MLLLTLITGINDGYSVHDGDSEIWKDAILISSIRFLLLISATCVLSTPCFPLLLYLLPLPRVLPLHLLPNFSFPSALCPEDTDSHGGIGPGGH